MKRNLIVLMFLLVSVDMFGQLSRSDVQRIVENQGFTVATERYAYLSEGETTSFYRKFYKGNEYLIIAYSEEYGVKDLDIYLYDEDDSLLERDARNEGYAIVGFSPSYTRSLKIVVKNYDSESSLKEYNCKFLVAYK